MTRGKRARPDRRTDQRTDQRGRHPRPARRDNGVWLYGRHPVEAVLANPDRRVHRLLVSGSDAVATEGRQIEAETVSRDELAALLPPDAVHQGVAALVSPLPAGDLEAVCRPPAGGGALVLVLDRVSDPRNVGAILRSAAAFAATAVIVPERHAPQETGVLAKAASGALETVPMLRVPNLARALDTLAELGYWRYGFAARSGGALTDTALSGNVALVLGAEGQGMRRLTAEHCDALVHLPIAEGSESLNVSTAAAIALFVTRQQLGWPPATD
jgi:23S rRNA (guanosine2251-2'-O)-methyltransferase